MGDGRDWRSLTDNEKRVVRNLLGDDLAQPSWEINGYVAREIDEYGSLALTPHDERTSPENGRILPVASGYFDDDNQKDVMGPMVELILFEQNNVLCELQIFRSDGSPMKKEIDPDGIFLIWRRHAA
ncbi:DUF6984 family protein [Neorhizobium galegae]|uniref:DUF6984 family protein n=1 Tax=Neorhizobium galegae TaxID=399 RepID=UPI000621C6D0|nr:hypothetical protein [Neorhizobium galegae]KAB1124215.1 hypothetical protein F4V90_11390 [Neorhizobium galegae]MCQ1809679.1 hypothetical protein [Neorhizobium galegae]CDZ57392.1 Hypothetical protein NGAL_HAMBI2566_19460 [Neorhizobium galegae bv. orientalis]CDZ63584.1 Hypothetical protein NGAL_HAMBI2605_25480 [Neorhizobium galegae bv. orientalis]